MSETLRVAQIGCGYWGPNLLRNLVAQPGCQVIQVVDADPARQAFVRERYPGVATAGDWRPLLEDDALDAVVLATPPSQHHAMARELLAAGKHLLVEKPLALTVAHAEELAALAAERKRVLLAGHTFLYNDAVRYAKQQLDAGGLGAPIYMAAQRLNLGQVRQDVDVWWNLAPHDLSIFLYLRDGQLPASVSCQGVRHLRPDVADVVFGNLRWEDGVQAHVQVSWLDPSKVRRLTLVCDRKMLVYDDVAEDKIRIFDRGVDKVPVIGTRMDYDGEAGFQLLHRTGDVLLPRVEVREPLGVELAHFLDCVRGQATPLSGPRHACDVVRLLAAGARSLAEGGRAVDPRELT